VEIALALILVAALAAFVLAPLWRTGSTAERAIAEDPEIADLEARKEAKYREIRDAELDREEGKLSHADWARIDGELRREAIEILRALDAARRAGDRTAPE
jgi:hypothetical protein